MNTTCFRAGLRKITALLFLLPLSVSFAAHAQTPAWAIVGPAFSSSVADIQKAASAIAPEKFMEATVLFERDAYKLDAQGRVTYRHSMIFRIETKAGVEDWAQTSERWEPWYQKQPEIHARVIGTDGRVSELDQKTITNGPAPPSPSSPIVRFSKTKPSSLNSIFWPIAFVNWRF